MPLEHADYEALVERLRLELNQAEEAFREAETPDKAPDMLG